MPIISIFFGIVIKIHNGDHNPPHFHATYGEFEVIIEIKSGKVLNGFLPSKALSLVQEWRKKHTKDILSSWDQAIVFKTPKKIKGLE